MNGNDQSVEAYIQKFAQAKVEEALAPYKDTILRLGQFLNLPVPPVSTAPKAFVQAQVTLQAGQRVHYKQGRGQFEATVLSVNSANGTAKLQRIDGKQIVRPMHKIY